MSILTTADASAAKRARRLAHMMRSTCTPTITLRRNAITARTASISVSEPACVNVCPEHAIISGDMDNPETEISKLLARETVSVRKPEKGTKPKLFYIDGDKASLDPTEAHPDSDYMWSSQRYGVGHYAKFAEAKKAGKQISQPDTDRAACEESTTRLRRSRQRRSLGLGSFGLYLDEG